MAIGRTDERVNPWGPTALQRRSPVWVSVAETHLGLRPSAASRGRTHDRNRTEDRKPPNQPLHRGGRPVPGPPPQLRRGPAGAAALRGRHTELPGSRPRREGKGSRPTSCGTLGPTSRLRRGSDAWAYLTGQRSLTGRILEAAAVQDAVREGPYGCTWFAHGLNGRVSHVEIRGPARTRAGAGTDRSAGAFAFESLRQVKPQHLVAGSPASWRRVGVVRRGDLVMEFLCAIAIVRDQHRVDAAGAGPFRPGIRVGIDVQMQQTVPHVARHRRRARAIVLVVAGAYHHPGGRQPVFADAVFPDQRCCDVEVGEAGLRQLVEEQYPPALGRQPVRPASHGAAVGDSRHAAEVGGIAGGEVGVDHLPTGIICNASATSLLPRPGSPQAIGAR